MNVEALTARAKGKGVTPGVIQFGGEKRVEVGVEKSMSYRGRWGLLTEGEFRIKKWGTGPLASNGERQGPDVRSMSELWRITVRWIIMGAIVITYH